MLRWLPCLTVCEALESIYSEHFGFVTLILISLAGNKLFWGEKIIMEVTIMEKIKLKITSF